MSKSPTQRTLEQLRNDGWLAEVVEKWIPVANKRKDLFDFIDVLAIRGDVTLAVQATSRSNVSARVKKITDHPNVGFVRDAGWLIQCWGWGKMANGRYECRKVDVS